MSGLSPVFATGAMTVPWSLQLPSSLPCLLPFQDCLPVPRLMSPDLLLLFISLMS